MKPKAILLDLDGTVAQKTNRNYYEWHKLDSDDPILPVLNIVRHYPNKIIILTARNEGYPASKKNKARFEGWSDEKIQTIGRKLTTQWVWLHVGDVEKIIMKPAHSFENSAKFKLDEYKKLCDSYDVEAIIDDNEQVCQTFKDKTNIQVIQIK